MSAHLQSLRWLLAELLVVILGVLIAFQVDAWNQGRIEQNRARQYVERLRLNIQEDIAELQSIAEIARFRLDAVEMIEQSLHNDDLAASNPGAYINALAQITFATPFTSNSATYAELTSTGDIGLLPLSLREAIYAYYGQAGNRASIDPAIDIRVQALDRFAGILTPEQMRLNYRYLRTTIPDSQTSPAEAIAAARRLRANAQAIAWLPALIQSHEATLVTTSVLLAIAEGLVSILDDYLDTL